MSGWAWDAWSWAIGPAVVGLVIGLLSGAYVRRERAKAQDRELETAARLMALAAVVVAAEGKEGEELEHLRRVALAGAITESRRLHAEYGMTFLHELLDDAR